MEKLLRQRKISTLGSVFQAFAFVVFAFFSQSVSAIEMGGADVEKGLEIAEIVKGQFSGWGSSIATLNLKTPDDDGTNDLSEWEMIVRSIEGVKGDNKQLFIVTSPMGRKNEKTLISWKKNAPHRMWSYDPRTKKTSRISGRELAMPFLDSEYALEDIGMFRVENMSYVYLGQEAANEIKYYKFEAKPQYKGTGYSKQVIWLDQEKVRLQRVDYYDLSGKKLKIQRFFNHKHHKDKYWRAENSIMRNVQTGRETLLKWTDVKFEAGLEASEFKKNSLKRIF